MSHLREHFTTGSPAAFPVIGGVEGSLKLGTQSLWSCRSEPGPLACGSGPRLLALPAFSDAPVFLLFRGTQWVGMLRDQVFHSKICFLASTTQGASLVVFHART